VRYSSSLAWRIHCGGTLALRGTTGVLHQLSFKEIKHYDFVDNNPIFELHPSQYTNDPFVISRNDKQVAINSALEVDLTGQVCADSLGYSFYSGIGGQVDFIRGAARSKGGKAIIALPSTARNATLSRIVPHLKIGRGS
jgi:4-hydroxybutyrate CoA-transferase